MPITICHTLLQQSFTPHNVMVIHPSETHQLHVCTQAYPCNDYPETQARNNCRCSMHAPPFLFLSTPQEIISPFLFLGLQNAYPPSLATTKNSQYFSSHHPNVHPEAEMLPCPLHWVPTSRRRNYDLLTTN
jgi:hypothetical protein